MKITDYKKEQLSNAMQQYYDFKIDNLDTIVFFQLGDFYELFFEDAVVVSQLLELTLTGKSAGLDEKVPMAGFPLSSLNDYVKRLMQFNMKVAIVDQDDSVVEKGKLVKRVLRKIITPGTYVDDLNADNNYVGCVESGHEIVLAYADVTTGDMFKTTFLNVDNLINQLMMLNIKEVVDVNNVLDPYVDVCEAYNINLINDIKYRIDDHISDELSRGCSTLLNYLNSILCGKIAHLKDFVLIEQNKYMYMSNNTQKQLELTSTLKDQEYYGSLFWYLNKTSTAMGRRLLKRMIIHPLVDEVSINYRHNILDSMTKNSILVTDITNELSKIYDFERLISRLADNSINPKELNQLKSSIKYIPMIKTLLSKFIGEDFITLADELDELNEVFSLIDNVLKEDIGIQVKEGGMIRSEFNEEVYRLRDIKNNSNQWLLDFELKEREVTGIKNLKIKYNKIFGYFIEITNGNLNEVPDNYVRKQTMANCERYITDELKEAENKILNASDLLSRLEFELYNELRSSLKIFVPRLQNVAYKIAFIDVMVAFSKVTIENHLVRPNFVEDDKVIIKDGFHPVVKKMVKNYINNDIIMNEDEQIMLITGPNMAGKSTYMRQFVTIVIMAQIGCFVPSKSCDVKIFDKVFTRIGASDDLSQGKSTFMVEMSETAEALKYATTDSLIIFDELGRGTSTYDGIALAQAILEYIHTEIKAKTLFSTHYHELIDLDKKFKGIKNVHVHAKEEDGKLTFFHKVSDGGVEKSYGIAVAKLANLPDYVVLRANQVINELELNHNIPSETKHKQFDLFTNDSLELDLLKEKISKIKSIDVNNITPIQALEVLNNIKNDL